MWIPGTSYRNSLGLCPPSRADRKPCSPRAKIILIVTFSDHFSNASYSLSHYMAKISGYIHCIVELCVWTDDDDWLKRIWNLVLLLVAPTGKSPALLLEGRLFTFAFVSTCMCFCALQAKSLSCPLRVYALYSPPYTCLFDLVDIVTDTEQDYQLVLPDLSAVLSLHTLNRLISN